MGGTLIRLVEQGHKVHVAYMTSGNIAVFDHDAWRFADFVVEFNRLFGIDQEQTERVKERVQTFLAAKKPGQPDSEDLLKIKGLIRATEARAAALACGVPPEQLDFLDLRFYRTGTIAKAPIHPQDIEDVMALMKRLQPAQIYVAGEMSDPHGTHRVCAEAIFEAVRRVRTEGMDFEVWLYRGAWEEWEPHEVERVVPLSPVRPGAQEAGDLPPPVAEGPGDVPRRHRSPRVLAACRGPQPQHGEGVRQAGFAGVLRAGGTGAVARRGGDIGTADPTLTAPIPCE